MPCAGYTPFAHPTALAQWCGRRASASRTGDQEIGDQEIAPHFLQCSYTSDLDIDTLMAALPSACHDRISARTGQADASVL